MANFVDHPKNNNITHQTINVVMGQAVQVGLWSFEESPGQALTIMTSPPVKWNSISESKMVRVYGFWDLPEGETRVEAVASTRGVWDWIILSAAKPKVKTGTRWGVVPDPILNAAIAARRKWGVPISVTLAQWAIESAWGAQMPDKSNNPFGMKAGKGQASSAAATQEENPDGTMVTIVGEFRKFATIEQAFDEHAKLLATSAHYVGAMANRDDPDKFADGLTKYATKSNYTVTLKHWMKVYDLYQYDQYGRTERYLFPDEVQFPKD